MESIEPINQAIWDIRRSWFRLTAECMLKLEAASPELILQLFGELASLSRALEQLKQQARSQVLQALTSTPQSSEAA